MDLGPSSVNEYITQIKIDLAKAVGLAEDLLIKMGQCEGRRLRLFRTIDAALTILGTNADDAQKMASVQWGEIAEIRTTYQGITTILEECVTITQALSSLIRGILRHCTTIIALCKRGMEAGRLLKYEIYLVIRSTLDRITFLEKETFSKSQQYCSQLETTVAAVKARQTGISLPQGDTVAALAADLARFKGALNKLRIASVGTAFDRQIENLRANLRFAQTLMEPLR